MGRKSHENQTSDAGKAASCMSTLMKCDNQSETEPVPRTNKSDHIVSVTSDDDSDIEILNDKNSMKVDDLKEEETDTQPRDDEENVRRCPLSGRLMNSPWISNQCGHIFDGIYILKYLRCNALGNKEAVECPIDN